MGKKLFQCKECGLWYNEQEIARKCFDYCRKYHSCNLEIIKHAVAKPPKK